jgi:hypothetical protein
MNFVDGNFKGLYRTHKPLNYRPWIVEQFMLWSMAPYLIELKFDEHVNSSSEGVTVQNFNAIA